MPSHNSFPCLSGFTLSPFEDDIGFPEKKKTYEHEQRLEVKGGATESQDI
jgi:hypothetical protein